MVEQVIALASTLLGALITAVTFIIKFVMTVKQRNLANAKAILEDAAREAVEFVEQLQAKSGEHLVGDVKKSIALVRINEALIKKGIQFNEKAAGEVIEALIELTKKVNVGK